MTNIVENNGLSDNQGETNIVTLFGIVWRSKAWVILSAIIGLLLGVYYTFFYLTPVYTSSVSVAFESRQEQVVDLENVIGGIGGDQASINTEVEVLRSRGLMEKVVNRLNLTQDPEFNPSLKEQGGFLSFLRGDKSDDQEIDPRVTLDNAVDNLLDRVGISNLRKSYVFKITVTTTDPRKTALIANEIANSYILDQLEVKFEATEKATQWLTERVAELQIKLESAVEDVKTFSSNSQLVSPEQLDALNRQLKDLRDRLGENTVFVTETEEQIALLQAAHRASDLENIVNLTNDRILRRLVALGNTGSDVDVNAFDTRFAEVVRRMSLDVARSQNQIAAFTKSITDLEIQIAAQSSDLVRLQQLEREADASRLIYEFFLGRLKETSVQQGIQQADSRILSAAVIPSSPSAPRKSIILALVMMLSSMIGAALVLLREFRQNTVRTAEQLETLTGQVVLGQIPVIPAKHRASVLDYLVEKPTSAAAEAVRNLRTSTLLSNVDTPPQIIMSTSSIPGEGKTTQSIALAQNFSGLGKRVLLIEGDIRRRVFKEYFNIKGKKGILSVLRGEVCLSDAVHFNDKMGVDLLIGEASTTNAADLFSSVAFQEFLKTARAEYDYVIIDTPPVLAVPDARVIGQFVDAILYTVRWDHTTKRQVSQGMRSFASVGLRITGFVLGQVSAKGMKRYGYSDDYGSYDDYYDN